MLQLKLRLKILQSNFWPNTKAASAEPLVLTAWHSTQVRLHGERQHERSLSQPHRLLSVEDFSVVS